MTNLRALKLATFAAMAFCVLSFASPVKANKDGLPRLPGEEFLVAGFPDGLALTVGDKTIQVEGGGDWNVIPSISADGRVIASARMVLGHPPETKPKLIVATYDITDKQWTDHKELVIRGGYIAISPDGSKVACSYMATGPSLLHILNLKTGKILVGPEVTKYAGSLTWSPDNQRIAFGKDVERIVHGPGVPPLPGIFILDTTDGTVSKVADGTAPSWSPSGEWIAFGGYTPGRDDIKRGWYAVNADRVSVIHPNGTGLAVVKLLKRDEDIGLPPVWSPNSEEILLQRPQDESVKSRMDIYILNLATLNFTSKFKRNAPVYGWVRSR